MPENSSLSTSVGFVKSSDTDAGDTANYSIIAGNIGGAFGVNLGTGEIVVLNPAALDFETTPTFTLTVRVTVGGGMSHEATVTINLTNVNETAVTAISDLNGSLNAVAENAANGTVVGITAFADDLDQPDTVTYSLDDNAGGRFAINAATGVVTVADGLQLDYETATSHSITVRATSTDASFSVRTFAINLTDVNETGVTAIADTNTAANAVPENAATGSLVGITALASDADGTDVISYSLTNNAGGRFTINSVTGVVTVADGTLLDRETAASHTITVRATSTDSSFTSQSYTINLIDVDEFDAAAITDTNAAVNAVNENAANGTAVGIVANSFDSDATTNAIMYSLDNNAGGRFAINTSTGVVTVANGTLLNYETAITHNIIVRATSTDGSTSLQSFTIALSDLNDTAPVITPGQVFSISELATTGTVIGSAVAVDSDSLGVLQGWTIESGNSDGVFAIDAATGRLTLVNTSALNFEAAPFYTLTLSVSDGVIRSLPQTVLIAVIAENEAPVFNLTPVLAINENAISGTFVGSVLATDVDAGDLLRYSIVSGNSGSAFALNAVSGQITVLDSSVLNYEAVTSFTLTIRVTDIAGLSDVQTVTIRLNDVNESGTDISVRGGTIAENAAAGSYVGQLTAIDPDAGDIFVYGLSNNAGGRFVVDAISGRITVAAGASLNYEAASSHLLTATATDLAGNVFVKSFTVSVTDLNEAPVAVSDTLSIAQMETLSISVGALLNNDTDEDADVLQAVLISGPAHGTLTLNADGLLTYIPGVRFYGVDQFVYQVTDGALSSNLAVVFIDVTAIIAPSDGGSGTGTGTGTGTGNGSTGGSGGSTDSSGTTDTNTDTTDNTDTSTDTTDTGTTDNTSDGSTTHSGPTDNNAPLAAVPSVTTASASGETSAASANIESALAAFKIVVLPSELPLTKRDSDGPSNRHTDLNLVISPSQSLWGTGYGSVTTTEAFVPKYPIFNFSDEGRW